MKPVNIKQKQKSEDKSRIISRSFFFEPRIPAQTLKHLLDRPFKLETIGGLCDLLSSKGRDCRDLKGALGAKPNSIIFEVFGGGER